MYIFIQAQPEDVGYKKNKSPTSLINLLTIFLNFTIVFMLLHCGYEIISTKHHFLLRYS